MISFKRNLSSSIKKSKNYEKCNKLGKFDEIPNPLTKEIEKYRKMEIYRIFSLLQDENRILKFSDFKIKSNWNKEICLSKLFMIRILFDLIEQTWVSSESDINWVDLCYLSYMQIISPSMMSDTLIREIKRKSSFALTQYIKRIRRGKLSKFPKKARIQKSLKDFMIEDQ